MSEIEDLRAENRALRSEVQSYRSAICFEVTCTGCAALLNKLAAAEAEIERLRSQTPALEV